MFLENKYKVVYDAIIGKAGNEKRIKGKGVYERHHVIPKSLGGNNNKENLVLLTPKEHYICHHLLVKFTSGKNRTKMMSAYIMMMKYSSSNDYRKLFYTARMYERARLYQCEISRNRVHREDSKEKTRNSVLKWHECPINKQAFLDAVSNREVTDEHRAIWSAKSKKYWNNLTPEQKDEISQSRSGKNNGMFGKTRTDAEKMAVSLANKGNQYSKGIKQTLKICPHCGKEGGNAMLRWHFDNCKNNIS